MVPPQATALPTTDERPAERARVALHLTIVEPPGRWRLEEEDVPETPLHDAIIATLVAVLKQWVREQGGSVLVARNLGCRWDPADARVGTDPDVVIVDPAPPEGQALKSLRIWEPGHPSPRVAVEVVSEGTADKDYAEAPARCARLGVRELWVFDPLLAGPSDGGGPYRLQVWRRPPGRAGELERVHAGSGPALSEEVGAYLVVTEGGKELRLANDAAGTQLWPTAEEAALAHADALAARADAAEAEVVRLRRLLEERR